MSKEHLVEAYLRGDIGRRVFVRRLVAIGISLTAALTYAQMAPDPAGADGTASAAAGNPCQLFPSDRVPEQALLHASFPGC